jgi:antitoxin component of RelBE/YafQ-DinJ toxin-antitoxin module
MKDEKDVKSCNMKIRISQTEKEALARYAAKHDLTMSEAIRQLCYKIFYGQEEET